MTPKQYVRTGSANPLMVRTSFRPYNSFGEPSSLYGSTEPLLHSTMLDTVTFFYTQVQVDLTRFRFQTLDGLRFSCHPRMVSRQFVVDEVRHSTLVQTKRHPDVIRKVTYRVQQPIEPIRISAIQLQIIQPDQSGSKGLSQVPEGNPVSGVLRPYHGFKRRKT